MKETQTKNKSILTKEVAEKEFTEWLINVRKVRESVITNLEEDLKECWKKVVFNLCDGTFSIGSDGQFTQKLFHPIGEGITEDPIKSLTYKTRVNFTDLDMGKKGKNATDEAKTKHTVSNLCGVQSSLIGKMDGGDVSVAGDLIAFYFLQ